MLKVWGDAPLVSANFVCVILRSAARLFIAATNLSMVPESQRARVSAKLLAEGMSKPWRSSSSVSCSPAWTATTDSLFA